jgi:hypothetical protein
MTNMNAKLNPGSDWWMEIGHNGNGNIEVRRLFNSFQAWATTDFRQAI